MVKLVDTLASGASESNLVGVRVSFRAKRRRLADFSKEKMSGAFLSADGGIPVRMR